MTRNLGLQYIWIDSSCITQDDREDWEEEAAQMVSTYQHAYVTIATSSSPDPSTPVFGERGSGQKTWQMRLGMPDEGEQLCVRRKVLPILEAKTRGSYAAEDWLPERRAIDLFRR